MDVARRRVRLSTSRKTLPQNGESWANHSIPFLHSQAQPLESIDENNSVSVSVGTIFHHERRSVLSPINITQNAVKRRSKELPKPSAEQSSKCTGPTVPKALSLKETSFHKYSRTIELGIPTVSVASISNSVKENVEFAKVTTCLATAVSNCVLEDSIDFVELSPEATSMYNKSKPANEFSVCIPKDKVCDEQTALTPTHVTNTTWQRITFRRNDHRSECRAGSSGIGSVSSPNQSMRGSFTDIIPLSRPRPAKTDEDDDEGDLPSTQPVLGSLLKSVVAYVEVRTGDDNRSWGVKDQLRRMGATIADRFTKDVTHVVFKEGSMATYRKALRLKIYLVSPLWIEECKIAGTIVSENFYPPSGLERYESPHLYPKLRRVRSMQPDFENKREAEYLKRKRKKRLPPENLEQENKILDLLYPTRPPPKDDSPSLLRALKCVAAHEPDYEDYVNGATGSSQDEDDVPPPLAIRLLREYMLSPLRAKPPPATPPESVPTTNSLEKTPSCSRPGPESPSQSVPPRRTSLRQEILKTPARSDPEPKPPSQSVPARRKSLRQEILAKKTQEAATEQKTDSFTIAKKSRVRKFDQNASHSEQKATRLPAISTQRRRKLMNITQPDESPVLITPIVDDDLPIRPKYPYTPPKSRKKDCKDRQTPVDMELTDVVPESNIILVNMPAKKATLQSKANTQKESKTENCGGSSMSRRSSLCFKKNKSQKDTTLSASVIKTRQLPTIVFTSLHREDGERVCAAVEALGGFEVEEKVSGRTTHVVTCPPARRTLNLLRGVARGCWIVTKDWVLRSQQAGKWVDEEKYEFTEFSPTVQQYRLEKLAFGPMYKPDLFSSCGPIYVGKNTRPPARDLSELIALCGGRVTSNPRNAAVVFGATGRDVAATALKESWVLDSIAGGSPRSVREYALHRTSC